MIHELRHYTAVSGKKDALLHRFLNGTLDLFTEMGFRLVAFWDRPGQEELWYVLEWTDEAEMQQAWDVFKADARWKALKATTETGGPLIKSIDSVVLTPLSPSGRRG